MRFVIAPNVANPWDQRMAAGLATALSELGHSALPLPAPLGPAAMVALCTEVGVDVLLQVNRFRPIDPPLPARTRHVSWFQDVFPHTVSLMDGVRESDIIYAMGDAQVIGLKSPVPCYVGSLVTGVDRAILVEPSRRVEQRIDFSLCGFIPPPLILDPNIRADLAWYVGSLFEQIPVIGSSWAMRRVWRRLVLRHGRGYVPFALRRTLRAVVEAMYQPLCGALDIDTLSDALYQEAALFVGDRDRKPWRRHWSQRGRLGLLLEPYRSEVPEDATPIDLFISFLARDYPRLLDRVRLIREALRASQSVELYGPGWQAHEEFLPYFKGIINDPMTLLAAYRRSRINLANNTHGFGLHSRTLECMAVGGFIFTHTSPHDTKPGGMLTAFEPGVHFGSFTPDTFQEEARRWLKDAAGRTKVGEQAALVVRDQHMWSNRAQQIVADLGR